MSQAMSLWVTARRNYYERLCIMHAPYDEKCIREGEPVLLLIIRPGISLRRKYATITAPRASPRRRGDTRHFAYYTM